MSKTEEVSGEEKAERARRVLIVRFKATLDEEQKRAFEKIMRGKKAK